MKGQDPIFSWYKSILSSLRSIPGLNIFDWTISRVFYNISQYSAGFDIKY